MKGRKGFPGIVIASIAVIACVAGIFGCIVSASASMYAKGTRDCSKMLTQKPIASTSASMYAESVRKYGKGSNYEALYLYKIADYIVVSVRQLSELPDVLLSCEWMPPYENGISDKEEPSEELSEEEEPSNEEEPSEEEEPSKEELSGEEKLLAITQTAAGAALESYVYVDMDHDGSKELIGVYPDNTDIYHTWYCSSDGETCFQVLQNNEWMDACEIELLDLKDATHVVINTYCLMGTVKDYSILSLKGKDISCLASNKYGYVRMTENGDITLNVEEYDGMYDPESGGMIGHTWKDTYLYFDGETYREYGAKEITETEFLSYKNAQNLKDTIAGELRQSDTTKLEYSYFIRENNILHIQCNVSDGTGAIEYGYYTVRFSGDALDGQPGAYTMGQMAPYFSDWDVTY